MHFYLQVILLLMATLIAILTLFNEVFREGIKTYFRILTIGLIVGSLGLQIKDEIEKRNAEKRNIELANNDRKERTRKEGEILKQINFAYDTIKSIQQKMSSQLSIQKNNNVLTQAAINKSKEIQKGQKGLISDLDRNINPIFPLRILVTLTVPLDSGKYKALISLAEKQKAQEIREDSIYNRNGIGYEHNRIEIRNPLRALSGDGLKENGLLLLNDIFFKKENGPKRTLFVPMGGEGHKIISEYLETDFEKKEIYVKIQYSENRFYDTEDAVFQKNFGFNDLLNSFLVFGGSDSHGKLHSVELFTEKGTIKYCGVYFSEKDVIWTHGFKRYKRKIIKENFMSSHTDLIFND